MMNFKFKRKRFSIGYGILIVLFFTWLMFGIAAMIATVAMLNGPVMPIYSELKCENGVVTRFGRKRFSKVRMNYIGLRLTTGKERLFLSGSFRDDMSFLSEINDEPITICFHQGMRSFGLFDQYAEIIYQGQRVINKYEERRLYKLGALERDERNMLGRFIITIFIPLILLIIIYTKKGYLPNDNSVK
ncbi:hypothetical protein N8878_03000 [Psychromonas sp.]|nr:hypothetical protein [Psychromonas sp.]